MIIPHPMDNNNDMTHIELFHGQNAHKQNPQNWLRTLEANKFKHDSDDDTCLYTFSKHLEYNSKANMWFRDELTPTQKDTWDKLITEFNRKWSAIAKVEPTKAKLQQKLLEIKLKNKEAQRVSELAEDIGDMQGLLISIIHNNLLVSICSLLPNDISTWPRFCDGVCNISLDHLGDEIECNNYLKSTNDTITNLTISSQLATHYNPPTTNYQCTPYCTPFHRYQPMAKPQTPSPPMQQTTTTPMNLNAPTTPSAP
ncbi:hypothetical protein PILCRDRAFT_16840 [Piloderma croceum F 1598]|uniref:Retrotransposon gag domain-containing protein n=1 Tax=Piloderma croceum (strain F 1598) TaxID=765440 RepID=A0A0C3AD21_PILCF|nr:hypothetical protein PILCRDRAFT_16840 [Piloderma croceum F 1598]